MKDIIIFGGTTEGRELAEILASHELHVVYCVATEYGKQPVMESNFLKIHEGRMTAEEMSGLYKGINPSVIVDATHPFAEVVKKEIASSIKGMEQTTFIRLLRDEDVVDYENCTFFENSNECAKALVNTKGNIFLTTGSKDLPLFCAVDSIRERLTVRVIPSEESIKLCTANGLLGKQIIAMQGPFSKAMNYAMFKDAMADIVVLKDSGKASGEAERIDAAKSVNAKCFIIKRPEEQVEGLSFEEVLNKLAKLYGIDLTKKNDVCNNSIAGTLEVILAGFGMGFGTITKEVAAAIEKADLIFGAPRLLAAVECKAKKYPYYLSKDIIPVLKDAAENISIRKAVILFSGDTSFYSGAKKMVADLKEIKECRTTILPGISSVSALAARCEESLNDGQILSTHGIDESVWEPQLIDMAKHCGKLFVLTSGSKDARHIGELLYALEHQYGFRFEITAGFNLYANEKIIGLNSSSCANLNEDGLCVLLIKNQSPLAKRLVPGLRDDDFIRNKTPMSKSEIRALSICKLGVSKNAVVYDIGSGSGSVAVELGLLDSSINVYAIEFKQEACDLIKENIDKFKLKNVKLIEGVAPEALKELPAPTHVFIGGSGGRLAEVINLLRNYNSPIRLVINAVTLETIAEVNNVLKANNIYDAEIVQVAITKAKRVGDYSVMQGQNPVLIATVQLNFSEQI